MRTVLLVPRRKDYAHRDKVWDWCRRRWERYAPDVPIYEGHHTLGPFNRSAAVNTAALAAGDWDVGVVIDSDIFIRMSQFRAAIETAAKTGKVTWAHKRWRGIREDAAIRIIDDGRRGADQQDFGAEVDTYDMDLIVERTNPISWSCCCAIPRKVWDDLGGFDERFKGWGFEDMAFQSVIAGLYGHERIQGDVYHLWHPRSEERIEKGKPATTATPEYVTNARLGRRYMVALRRDFALHDRDDLPANEEERERDITNLKRDDAKLSRFAQSLGLPNLDKWWPSLEELREGAKAYKDLPHHSVTLIVHTDGRREYIAKSIPSLVANVKGEIVKRVIYDDSGDPDYKAWLKEQFEGIGFYVVGPEHRLGYTDSMRAMWKYLNQRCNSDYVFLAEDDFLYDQPVDLMPMIEVLGAEPHLRQLALLRHAYYPKELEAGSIINEHPEAYEYIHANGHSRVEHRLYFTANPSLFRRSLTAIPWPAGSSSERAYTDILNRDPDSRFAYWGAGEELVTHIGAERAGRGY